MADNRPVVVCEIDNPLLPPNPDSAVALSYARALVKRLEMDGAFIGVAQAAILLSREGGGMVVSVWNYPDMHALLGKWRAQLSANIGDRDVFVLYDHSIGLTSPLMEGLRQEDCTQTALLENVLLRLTVLKQ